LPFDQKGSVFKIWAKKDETIRKISASKKKWGTSHWDNRKSALNASWMPWRHWLGPHPLQAYGVNSSERKTLVWQESRGRGGIPLTQNDFGSIPLHSVTQALRGHSSHSPTGCLLL
jgi:hypothetical protein